MTNTKKGLLIAATSLIVTIIGIVVIFLLPAFAATQKTNSFTTELGKPLDTSASTYITCEKWSLPFTIVDTSDVDITKVGTYPITVYHGFQKFTYENNIVDTTPPEITCSVSSITVEKGKTVNMSSLGIRTMDRSDITSCIISTISSDKMNLSHESATDSLLASTYKDGVSIQSESFEFLYGGIYEITILATDAYDNSSTYALKVNVEEPPVIEGTSSYYVAKGNEIDFSKYITTWDYLDQNYSLDDVVIDTSSLHLDTTGTYQVPITGTDNYGLSTTFIASVYVYETTALQDLINTHSISLDNNVIIGALNLYDNGYFNNETADFIQEAVRPTLVHVYNAVEDMFGSGYILDISDEFVTIATNSHVIRNDMMPEVYFSDGSMRHGAVVSYVDREDIAFIRLPINTSESETSITPEYVHENLRSVHINEGYWNSLSNDAGITLCYNCIDETGATWQKSTGTMVEKTCIRNWNQYIDIDECIISSEPVPGSSGSAIFDESGRMIAMMRGYTRYPGYIETVAIPLNIILDYYEEIFGEPVNYQ